MKNEKLISIIIVNYSGKKFLKDCFNSLKNINYNNFEVIMVDNGSTDDSVKYVKSSFPWVRVIQNEKNLGFAQGNNIGIKASRGEYILFLNNDTIVEPDFLIELVKIIESNPSIGVCQSKLLLMDDKNMLDSVGSFLTQWGFISFEGVYERDNGQYDKYREVFSVKGVSMIVRRKVLEEVGIFDSDFFAYFEESDLCWRAWLGGYKVAFVPWSIVYHKFGGTSTDLGLPFVYYHSYKNRICSLIKNLNMKNLINFLPIHIILCIGISFYYIFRKLQMRKGLAILKAIMWTIINFNKTLEKRKFIQEKVRKFPDTYIMSKVLKKRNIKYFFDYLDPRNRNGNGNKNNRTKNKNK